MHSSNGGGLPAVILVLLMILSIWLGLYTYNVPLVVVDQVWQTWQRDEKYDIYHWTTESCSTSRNSKGTSEQSCTTTWHSDYRWQDAGTRYLRGAYGEPIRKPEIIWRGEGEAVGNIRPAGDGIEYKVVFKKQDGGKEELSVGEDKLKDYPVKSTWTVKVNIVNLIWWNTLTRTN